MTRGRKIVGIIVTCFGCATAAVLLRTSTSIWQAPSAEEERAWAQQREQQLSAIREDVRFVIAAYRSKDEAVLRGWATDSARPAAQRAYAAYLLMRLDAPDAERMFVENFPAEDSRQYQWFDDLNESLETPETEDVQVQAQHVLICGAVRDVKGAAEKLIKLRAIVDAADETDNCCGLVRLAIARPDEALARMATASAEDGLLHVFQDEATATEAAQLLQVLANKSYDDPQRERLRVQLLPVLREKSRAKERGQLCAWLDCENGAKAPAK